MRTAFLVAALAATSFASDLTDYAQKHGKMKQHGVYVLDDRAFAGYERAELIYDSSPRLRLFAVELLKKSASGYELTYIVDKHADETPEYVVRGSGSTAAAARHDLTTNVMRAMMQRKSTPPDQQQTQDFKRVLEAYRNAAHK